MFCWHSFLCCSCYGDVDASIWWQSMVQQKADLSSLVFFLWVPGCLDTYLNYAAVFAVAEMVEDTTTLLLEIILFKIKQNVCKMLVRILTACIVFLWLFCFRAMSSAATALPSVDKVDGFSRKSVRKAKQKRAQSSSQFRSQDKPIELVQLPLLKGIKPTMFR